jgi:hypothetical protein
MLIKPQGLLGSVEWGFLKSMFIKRKPGDAGGETAGAKGGD